RWSKTSRWETGLLDAADWKADWIGYDLTAYGKGDTYHLPPAPYLRKEEKVARRVESARLYITALGVYEFFISGKRVGDDYFAAWWTEYNKRVYYYVDDVTEYMRHGNNAFAATVSYGWSAGYLGYALLVGSSNGRCFYGDVRLIKAQVEIT